MPLSTELQSTFDELRKNRPELEEASDAYLYGYAKAENPSLSWDEMDNREKKSSANTCLLYTSPSPRD